MALKSTIHHLMFAAVACTGFLGACKSSQYANERTPIPDLPFSAYESEAEQAEPEFEGSGGDPYRPPSQITSVYTTTHAKQEASPAYSDNSSAPADVPAPDGDAPLRPGDFAPIGAMPAPQEGNDLSPAVTENIREREEAALTPSDVAIPDEVQNETFPTYEDRYLHKPQIYFSVQIGAFSQSKVPEDNFFKKIAGEEVQQDQTPGGLFRYSVGRYYNYSEALAGQKRLRALYKGAYIVAYDSQNQRLEMDIKEVLKQYPPE